MVTLFSTLVFALFNVAGCRVFSNPSLPFSAISLLTVYIAHRVGLYYSPSCSTNRPRRNSHTCGYGFLVQLELAAGVENRLYKFTITASRGPSISLTRTSLPAIINAFYAPFPSAPFAWRITKRPVICHRHCRRGTIRRRGGSWKEGWFSNRSSDGEGVFTWSVLPLVAGIDPHTFNSGDAYPLNPRQ